MEKINEMSNRVGFRKSYFEKVVCECGDTDVVKFKTTMKVVEIHFTSKEGTCSEWSYGLECEHQNPKNYRLLLC